MEDKLIKYLTAMIVLVIVFVVFIVLYDKMTGGNAIRTIICGMLFWIPGAANALALTQGCSAIPAI